MHISNIKLILHALILIKVLYLKIHILLHTLTMTSTARIVQFTIEVKHKKKDL